MKNKFIFLILMLFLAISSISVSIQAEESDTIKTYQLKKKWLGSIRGIVADLRYMDLKIKPSKDQYAYLSYKLHCKNKKNPFTYNIKDGVLNLKEEKWKGVSWKNYDGSNKKEWKKLMEYSNNMITLFLPKDSVLENGIVSMIDGNLTMEAFHCGDMDLNFRYGDIYMNNSAISGKVKIKAKDADINIKDAKAAGAVDISTVYGDITISDFQTKKGIKIKTKDGDINIKDTKVSEMANVNSYYGDINISKLACQQDIRIKTNDGDVKVQMKEKQLKKRKIVMQTTDGEMSAASCLSDGIKKRKADGWYYQKYKGFEKVLLKIMTYYGDISLEALY